MTRRPGLCAALTLLALLFIFDAHALAQESPTPTPQATPEPKRLRFNAYDDKGSVQGPLKRENVHVFYDEAEQPVTSFAVDVSPASYGLVVDNSGSLHTQIGAVIAAAQALAYSNRPADETFVVRFVSSDDIKIMQDFTSDKPALVSALADMYIEGGQTALLDALYLSADHIAKHARPGAEGSRRRALVLITDGEERASFYRYDDVLKMLREADVQVFAIGLTSQLDRTGGVWAKSKFSKSVDLLERLTSETGGRVYFASKVIELRDAIVEIDKSLHSQYVVGYTPPAATPETSASQPKGARHKLEVKAFGENGTDSLKVVLRPDPSDPLPTRDGKKKSDDKKKTEDKQTEDKKKADDRKNG